MPAPVVIDTIQPGTAALMPVSATLPVDEDDAASSVASATRGDALKQGKTELPTEDRSLCHVASASAAVLGAAVPASHYAGGHEKTVNFLGLYVVRGPTSSKNVHYMMDIAIAKWGLRFRIAQRFRSFRQMRQRLFKALKRCPGPPARSSSQHMGALRTTEVMDGLSPGKELLRMITERASAPCACCSVTRKMAAAMKFPKRKFVFTNRQDVHERSLMLEAFLGYCIELLMHWTGCKRGRMAWATLLDVFLDANLHEHVRADLNAAKRDPSEDRVAVGSAFHSSGASSPTPATGTIVDQAPLPVKTDVPMLVLPQHSADMDSDFEHTTDAMFSFISIDSSAPPASSSALHFQS